MLSQLTQHRVDACATLTNKTVTTAPDLGAALGASAARRYVRPLPLDVIYYTKLHGEAQRTPYFRLPPFNVVDVQMMLEAARGRFSKPCDKPANII